MKKFATLSEMIAIHAKDTPDAVAITAPAAKPLTYQALNRLVEDTVNTLNRLGIGNGDRVGIVLPNCPEMATAFVAIASGCTAAPLNMAYRADEFEFYLLDLKARALVVAHGSETPAREVAEKLGIAILELTPHPEIGAGSFTISGTRHPGQPGANGGMAQTGDIALILHTSGTTSRPKIVPLTQKNVCASARNISVTLNLRADDRGLHIMPLFHIHGLIAGVLAPLAVGSQIFCTPGFNALKFFGWMKECKPTWYTAVPTMHQTILSRASHNMNVIESNPLRFIRSSSSSMPTKVIAELEQVFKAPLIESYGMTEAAHQMASNPLPPARRIPGSVGIAAGPEVAIMDSGRQAARPGCDR